MGKNLLYQYPEIRTLLPSYREGRGNLHQTNTEVLLGKIEPYAEELIYQAKKITYTHVCRLIDVPLDSLLYYNLVRTRIDQLIRQQKEYKENCLLKQLDIYLSSPISCHLSKSGILTNLGISEKQLRNFPLLRTKISEILLNEKRGKIFAKPKRDKEKKIKNLIGIIYNREGEEIRIYKEK